MRGVTPPRRRPQGRGIGRGARMEPLNRARTLAAHLPALKRFARRLEKNPSDAEDLVQDTLHRLLRAQENGNAPEDTKAYLFRTLRNMRIDRLRQAKPCTTGEPDAIASPANPEEQLYCSEVLATLEHLPKAQARLLRFAAAGLTMAEMAERLAVAEGTVFSRLSRARAALRARLER